MRGHLLYLSVMMLYISILISKNSEGTQDQTTEGVSSIFDRENCECGLRAASDELADMDFIVGRGTVVKPVYKYPFMIALFSKDSFKCSASIISRDYVLTAAHCVAKILKSSTLPAASEYSACSLHVDKKMYCLLPTKELELRYNGLEECLSRTVGIRWLRVPRQFSWKGLPYDAALLRTAEPLPCNHFTAPICLPADRGRRNDELDKKRCAKIAGWGWSLTNATGYILRAASMKVKSHKFCTRYRKGRYHGCARGFRQGACKGDSGGPLFKLHNGRYYLTGVISFGLKSNKTCDPDLPTFYTKIKYILPWMEQTINSMRNEDIER